MLAPRFPYPPFGGDKLFLLNVAKGLRPHRITLLTFCSTRAEMEIEPDDGIFSEIHKVHLPRWQSMRNALRALAGSVPLQLAYYSSPEFRRKFEALAPSHDAILAHLIRTGQYAASGPRDIPRILLMADAISLTYERMAALPGTSRLWHALYQAELKRLHAYERECPAWFDQTWLHSDVDRSYLGMPPDRARIVPMGIDLEDFPYRANRRGNAVAFIGNMSSSVNLDACMHFISDILPRVRARADVRFRVVGACPRKLKRKLSRYPGVEVTGAVFRIADGVNGAFCGVCPLRGGAGIQNKMLNYLALGLPCVTSQIGLGGVKATPGREVLLYRNPEEAAEQILDLHADANLRNRLALAGRALVESRYDWKRIYPEFGEFLFQAGMRHPNWAKRGAGFQPAA